MSSARDCKLIGSGSKPVASVFIMSLSVVIEMKSPSFAHDLLRADRLMTQPTVSVNYALAQPLTPTNSPTDHAATHCRRQHHRQRQRRARTRHLPALPG